jgi:hypothetical protein
MRSLLAIPIGIHAQALLVVNYAAINANMLNLWVGKGMKTILEDLGRTLPYARKLQPAALIDATVVRDAVKEL